MKRVLILDDNEERHEGFRRYLIGCDRVHVRTYWECVEALRNLPRFDEFYLDHDLGDCRSGDSNGFREYTGADVAEVISHLPLPKRPRLVRVHSWNPTGADAIVQILRRAAVPVMREPYGEVIGGDR